MTAREDLCACPRCGSGEWSYCDYGGCSKCRPHEERETEDNDAAATVTARKDLFACRYGVKRNHRLPFTVKFRKPIVVSRLHVFDADADSTWHSEACWCRRG